MRNTVPLILYSTHKNHNFISGVSSDAKISCKDEKYGLIFSIISLSADVRIAESLNFMVQIIFELLVRRHANKKSDICINAMNAEGPHLTLSSIMDSFGRVHAKDEFSMQSMLDTVRRATFRPDSCISRRRIETWRCSSVLSGISLTSQKR